LRKAGSSPFVLIVESSKQKTGVPRLEYGTWLPERRLTPRYGYVGTTREGVHFVFIRYAEQIPHQGLDPQGMPFSVSSLMGCADWAVSSQQLSSRSSSFRSA
ncbi:hypothetical protein B0H13DRAFT_1599287, partial [Mycena leptocephala]